MTEDDPLEKNFIWQRGYLDAKGCCLSNAYLYRGKEKRMYKEGWKCGHAVYISLRKTKFIRKLYRMMLGMK